MELEVLHIEQEQLIQAHHTSMARHQAPPASYHMDRLLVSATKSKENNLPKYK